MAYTAAGPLGSGPGPAARPAGSFPLRLSPFVENDDGLGWFGGNGIGTPTLDREGIATGHRRVWGLDLPPTPRTQQAAGRDAGYRKPERV